MSAQQSELTPVREPSPCFLKQMKDNQKSEPFTFNVSGSLFLDTILKYTIEMTRISHHYKQMEYFMGTENHYRKQNTLGDIKNRYPKGSSFNTH